MSVYSDSLLAPNLDILQIILGYLEKKEILYYIHEIVKTHGYNTKSFRTIIEKFPLFLDYFTRNDLSIINNLQAEHINIYYLNLNNSENFTDDDIKLLVTKSDLKLQSLDLSNNEKITNKGLLLLSNLTNLTFLDLSLTDPYTIERSFTSNGILLLKTKLRNLRIIDDINYRD